MNKDTFISRLLDNEDILIGMMSVPNHVNREIARKRREELFSFLWEYTSMDRVETLNMVNQRELDFVREYKHTNIPEWLLRMEAQDVILQIIHEKFEDENLI